MSTHSTVEVYLGNPIEVPSEQAFLARLQRDLADAGVSARILANVHLGRPSRQIDCIVIAGVRVIQIELKTFAGPIVSASVNGTWTVQVGASHVSEVGNPAEQARGATYAFSDALEHYARRHVVPGPSRGKYYKDIDSVVCAFPDLPAGSTVDRRFGHVSLIGYPELIDRLRTPGPRVLFSPADWDGF